MFKDIFNVIDTGQKLHNSIFYIKDEM